MGYKEMNLFKGTQVAKDALARINAKLGFVADMLDEEEEEKEEQEEVLEEHFEIIDENNMEVSNSTMESDDLIEANKTITKRHADEYHDDDEEEGQIKDKLLFEDVLLMYNLCRYERARNPDSVSTWCAPFEKEDLMVMEYYVELEYWHKNGYFYEINSQFACPLMENLFTAFEGHLSKDEQSEMATANNMTINNTSEKDSTEAEQEMDTPAKATLYFSHSEAVLPFLTLLGLNKDDYALTHDNYEEAKERRYRVSKMGPFSANVGFLMMECDEAPMNRIMTLVQEKPVMLPKCDSLACDWQIFKENYKDDISCKFEEICEDDGTPLSVTSLQSNSFKIIANYVLLALCFLVSLA